MNQDSRVNILIVDDKPEKVMALEAIVGELGETVVKAYSGKEALRCCLQRDFAVILLDVNMPGMDGFETAALIRQRKQSATTPIIFVTAFGDDMHVARGYSLGAVDYILAPVVPEVLRTKVSVFVEIHRKTEQLRRQAEWLQTKAAQLHKLTWASTAINSALASDKVLSLVTDSAREILGCHHASMRVQLGAAWSHATTSVSHSQGHGGDRRREDPGPDEPSENGTKPFSSELCDLVCRIQKPLRLTQAELEAHPAWQEMGTRSASQPPTRGWLGVPLTGRDGRNMGLLQLADREAGDFTQDDEAILVQLAQIASVAIENILLTEAREANHIKEEFLATLSHELRTPLNAILGWAQILRKGNLTQSELDHGLEVIDRNVKAQSKLIEDLLDISRVTAGKIRLNLRETSVSAILQAAIDAVKPTASLKDIRIDCGKVPSPDVIAADPDRLQQVIWNLLTNAIKFTPPRGKVEVLLERSSSRLQIRVSDNGQGISRDFLPFIFERFRQEDQKTTRTHGGLGIGLAIVRHIVELHGGRVHAESPGEGQGATFVVDIPDSHSNILPGAPSAPVPETRSPAPVEAPRNDRKIQVSGLSVLIIDDNKDARDLLSRILAKYQALVMVADSATEAFKCIDRSRPDVIVSDISMPEQDGYAFIKRLRKRTPERGGNIPSLALTGLASDGDRSRILQAGFQMHMAKPVDPEDFLLKIADLTRRAIDPQPRGALAASDLEDKSSGLRTPRADDLPA